MLRQELPPMPAIVKDIVTTFKKKHKKANTKMILAMTLSNIAFMITSKRILTDFAEFTKEKRNGQLKFKKIYI